MRREEAALQRWENGESTEAIAASYGVSPHSVRRWRSEERSRAQAQPDGTRVNLRRCRNKDCDEQFVPLNPQHWYHEPACRAAEPARKKSVQEILTDEAGLPLDAHGLEIAKSMAGQKNRALREVSRLRSLRDYLSIEVKSFYEDNPEFRTPMDYKAPVRVAYDGDDRELVLILSDWQTGKLENGIGVDVMRHERIPRILGAFTSIVAHFRAAGYPVNVAHVLFVGDMIEGCYIYRGQNVTGLDRTGNTHRLTRQIMLAAELQAEVVRHVAAIVPEVWVEVVGGNHGRPNGPNDYADPEDNFDVMAAHWSADKCSDLPNVDWNIVDHWWNDFIAADHRVVMMHGDQWNGPLERVYTLLPQYVTSDVFKREEQRPDILVLGHRHDFAHVRVNSIDVVQNGTIDGGSNWYLKAYGKASRPAQTALVLSRKHGLEAIYPIHM